MSAPTNVAPVIIKRKIVKGGEGHHGGAWKVAYADFVTAMMAFFMLMWLLNATTEKQRKGIADYFSPTIPISRVSGGGDGMFQGETIFAEETLPRNGTGASSHQATASKRARGQSGVDADGGNRDSTSNPFSGVDEALTGQSGESMVADDLLQHIVTRVTDEGLIIELFALDDRPLFVDGTDTPTDLLRNLVRIVVRASGLVTNDVAVAGYVRSYPVTLAVNPVWDLSHARADRVRQMMQISGTDRARFQRIEGHADRDPVDPDPMAERNNRLEVILLRN